MARDIIYLEPIGGIAGDMFLAAALDMGVPRGDLERGLATLGPLGFHLEVTRVDVGGIQGTHVDVEIEGGQAPGHGEVHRERLHGRGLGEILGIIARSGLPPRAREAARAVFERIGAAESRVHGVPVAEVHFHEVGAIDSIVDVCGAALVLDLLGWPEVVAAPPELGHGFVETAHGRLPVPPPAVLEILQGVPVRPGGPPGEAVTPTGAALLAVLCRVAPAPVYVPRRTGYGVGTARWPDRPNVLRMTHGEPTEGARAAEALLVLECNLDDCPGQLVARAVEAALEVGALDAWAAPLTMKKGRPGVLLSALVPEQAREAVSLAFLSETTTLGVRFHRVERVELDRELRAVDTPYGKVRVKVGRLRGRELGAHPEYDDCAALAREKGVPVKEVAAAALAAYRAR